MSARFGVARKYGNDLDKYLETLRKSSVDAYEVGFAFGVPKDFPMKVVDKARIMNVTLTCHLPFFINLGNDEKVANSVRHLVEGLKIAEVFKGIAVFHLGFYGERTFKDIKHSVCKAINYALSQCNVNHGRLGVETTGKIKEIGTLEEVMTIIEELARKEVIPIIDWSHVYARSNGRFPRTPDDFRKLICKLETCFNPKEFYFHGGGIEYSEKGGERRHISAKSCEPPLPFLMAVLREQGYDFTLIVESPTAIDDAIWLKEVYKCPQEWFAFTQQNLKKSRKDSSLDLFMR